MQSEKQTNKFAHEYAQALAMVVVDTLTTKQTEAKKDGNKIRANTIKECIEHIRLWFILDNVN